METDEYIHFMVYNLIWNFWDIDNSYDSSLTQWPGMNWSSYSNVGMAKFQIISLTEIFLCLEQSMEDQYQLWFIPSHQKC